MTTIILILHLLIALALVGVILLQRSEGGALGIGGGGMGGLMTGRSSANLLTRVTAVLAAAFITTSLLLAILAAHRTAPRSILDQPSIPAAPAVPSDSTPAEPAQPAEPAVPSEPAAPSAPVAD
jgi:preprotein translocase subunit SecG